MAIGRGNSDRVGYAGHVMDSATGLTYMQQRYYDPMLGRFLSVDPVTA
ncbi:RHS repeat-associated core domain-containing protein [Solilutibacter pythonis]